MTLWNHAVRCAVLGALLMVGLPAAQAQQAAPADAATVKQWKELVAKKQELVDKLKAMQARFETADDAEKQKIAKEAQTLEREFQTSIVPTMVKLAPAIYAADPQNVDAAEVMLQVDYSQMKYAEAAAVADAILAQDPKHQLALNIGGVSNFAEHHFEKAVQQLETAVNADVLIPQLGGQYFDSAHNYIDYWKKEQQIRKQEESATGDQQLPLVKMTTSKGDIVLELFENEAPNTVANFISLTEQKFYDGLKFHRVIPNFMAQGGDPNTKAGAKGQPGTGGPGYTIKCEAYEPNARRHFAGTLSMAKMQERDTGGSQFFITHLPTPHLDQEVRPESVHTVFGRVMEGMDVVRSLQKDDTIEKVEVVRKRNHEYKPVTQPSAK